MEILQEIKEKLAAGKSADVTSLIEKAIADGCDCGDILNNGLLESMEEVGKRFQEHEIFLPHVLLAAKAMKKGMEVLRPKLVGAGVQPRGKIAIGTVAGDIHDIGQVLVGMMLEGAGFEVDYLGNDVAVEKFVEAAREGAQVLGLSALLTTTMPVMKSTIKALEEAGLRDKVKIMVGGAPVDRDFAKEIGADAYGPDAVASVEIAKSFIS